MGTTNTIEKFAGPPSNSNSNPDLNSDQILDPKSDHSLTTLGTQVPPSNKLTNTLQNSGVNENPQIVVSMPSNNVAPTCSVTPSTQNAGLIMSTILNKAHSPSQTHIILGTCQEPPASSKDPNQDIKD